MPELGYFCDRGVNFLHKEFKKSCIAETGDRRRSSLVLGLFSRNLELEESVLKLFSPLRSPASPAKVSPLPTPFPPLLFLSPLRKLFCSTKSITFKFLMVLSLFCRLFVLLELLPVVVHLNV